MKVCTLKKYVRWSCFLVSCMFLFVFPMCVKAADTDQKATIHALNSSYAVKISIPDDLPQSYQIPEGGGEDVTYRVVHGYSAQVSADGLVTPKYKYKKGDQVVTEEDDYDSYSFESGDTEIEVKTAARTYNVIVTVEDYAVTYGEKVMDAYLEENISDGMTDQEILDVIARFPASYDYGQHPSAYTMIIFGDGSCAASTGAVIRLCEKLGIKAWTRNGNKDPQSSGSHHVNAMVELHGTYYIVESGYVEPKGEDGYRHYSVWPRSTLFSYYNTSDGLSIFQYDGIDEAGELEVPETIDGKAVVGIEKEAFFNTNFSKIQLPDTVTEIGDFAFSCSDELTSINIPASVASIGKSIFSECYKLTDISIADENENYKVQDQVVYTKDGRVLVTCPTAGVASIPSTVTRIADYAFFENINLKSIVIPESVVELGDHAFEHCSYLSSMTFEGEGLTTIGADCFRVNRLSVLRLPSSVTSIGASAFAHSDLKYIYFSGDAPTFGSIVDGEYQDQVFEGFADQDLNAYYVEGNSTWTQDVLTAHGGNSVTWSSWAGRTESMEGAVLTLEQDSYRFTGKEIIPEVSLALDGRTLEKGRDYIVTYADNLRVGTATVVATGIGAYEGRIQSSFQINKAETDVRAYALMDEILENDTTKIVCNTRDCTFTSGDPSIATVDSEGNIRGVSAGSTEIIVSQPESESYLAGTATVEIRVVHNEVVGTTVTDGRVEIKCDRCGLVIGNKTVPSRFVAYWGESFQDYDNSNFRKRYQVGETLECRTSDVSNSELREIEIISLDESVVQVERDMYLNFIADGVAKVVVRPKYNPAIGKTFTFYVGNATAPDEGGSGDNNQGSGGSGDNNQGSGGSGNN